MTMQKRLEIRVNVDFNADVYELIICDKPIVLPKVIRMKVINLSVSGVLLFSEIDMAVGIHFGTVLRIDNTDIYVACLSVRKEVRDSGFYYGCTLLGVSQSDQQVIRQFIFKQEVRERRRMKKEQNRSISL